MESQEALAGFRRTSQLPLQRPWRPKSKCPFSKIETPARVQIVPPNAETVKKHFNGRSPIEATANSTKRDKDRVLQYSIGDSGLTLLSRYFLPMANA